MCNEYAREETTVELDDETYSQQPLSFSFDLQAQKRDMHAYRSGNGVGSGGLTTFKKRKSATCLMLRLVLVRKELPL